MHFIVALILSLVFTTSTKALEVTDGKGTWVNIWNYPKDVDTFVNKLNKFKIDTIYLQINRSNTEVFKNKKAMDEILKKAHQKNIKVIGWSYCFLKNIKADANKYIEPALYVSPDGEKLDAMAADIEENTELKAVREYTRRIKKALPDDYPMIAITYSPKIKQEYPWQYVGRNWDVLMPMTYWHSLKKRNNETVYNFVRDSIIELKKLTRKKDLKIHLITDGDRTHHNEVKASIKAARDFGINAGVSIYPAHLASDDMLKAMQHF